MNGTAVVTGATGFIGTHLTRALAARGANVRALDKRAPAQPLSAGVRFEQIDLRATAALRPLLVDAHTVYHLASAHLQVNEDDTKYRDVNVRAAAHLVRACAEAGVRRFVHASTVGIYGHVAAPPAREDAEPAPGNVYERTKLEGERAVRDAAASTGIELIVLRPAWVYGPGCPRTAKLLRTIRRGHFVYIGKGSNLRHPIFIADAVEAFLLAGAAPAQLSGRSYLIAGPRHATLRELVDTCAAQLGVNPPRRQMPRSLAVVAASAAELFWRAARSEPPFSRRSIAFFENDNAFDISAARLDLGFEPVVSFEEGIRRTVEDGSWAA